MGNQKLIKKKEWPSRMSKAPLETAYSNRQESTAGVAKLRSG